jgi:Vacuolar sorting 38 and autophagy-related subunit 14
MYVVLGLSHIAHLLTLVAEYLSLKLPYEIVPPSRGTPYHSIRKSSTTKPLPLNVPPDPSTPSPAKAWAGKKIKDMPHLESLVEAMSLIAWDVAWMLWAQQLWPPAVSNTTTSTAPPRGDAQEACRLARNMYHLVSSTKIGRISHSSTIEFLPIQEATGILSTFTLSVKNIQDVISTALEEEKTEADGAGWDMVEGGEEVLRGDGWLKLFA